MEKKKEVRKESNEEANKKIKNVTITEEETLNIHCFNPLIYPRLIWVAIGISDDLLNKFFNTEVVPFRNCNDADMQCIINKSTFEPKAGVLIRFASYKQLTPGTIAHEAIHTCTAILDDLGVKYTGDSDESIAYLLGWLVDCITDIKKQKKHF